MIAVRFLRNGTSRQLVRLNMPWNPRNTPILDKTNKIYENIDKNVQTERKWINKKKKTLFPYCNEIIINNL